MNQPSIGQVKVGERSERTAGVEISEYRVFQEDTSRILFYDFVGQPEFQSTHSILLQNLFSFSESSEPSPYLFLIILDITAPDKLKQLKYSANFSENCPSTHVSLRPEVIIIGSRFDKLPTNEDVHEEVKDVLRETVERRTESIELIDRPILLDCRDPSVFELQKVKALLLRSTENLKKQADLDNRSHLVFAYLYKHFPDKPVKLSELRRSLREQKLTDFDFNELPFTRKTLVDLLEGMHLSLIHI